ncbi:alpha-L-fucosidase [Maribacter sp.]|nr:alpha-L-fucosidase [Maribacter sp.]
MTYLKKIGCILTLAITFSCNTTPEIPSDISPNAVIPSDNLVTYQQMELIGFIHFTVNTFTDKEWGYGDEDPAIFNPSELNVTQWVETAKAAGMKQLILTAKHHDGFCLWPSQYTEHSVKNSPYKNGTGDIVKEFVEACRKHGLKAGLYLSPWDRNHAAYGTPEYLVYYQNQLRELLTQYGEVNEIWFDGANGGDGYYGGANEIRKIDGKTYYNWPTVFSLVKELQPDIKIFSDAGPDVHWIGNENGFAGATFWSTINKDNLVIGTSETDYLNSGDAHGKNWIVGQCDVSIRPGWFYHQKEDSLVKTPQHLVDIYYKSIGRNALLLLNLPPDKRGLIHENDVKALLDFRTIIDETFEENLAAEAIVTTDTYRLGHKKFAAENVVDTIGDTYWATDDAIKTATLTLQLTEEKEFDRIMIQEPIRYGQRISRFEVDVLQHTEWKTVFKGTTIGYKRLIRIDPIKASKIRVRILEGNNSIALSNVALFKASEKE